jgi:hypothetical protein
MRRINNKKAAFEMSMSTIVIIVLAISMLILGLVLTKKIMCAGIGLTDEINSKVTGEVQTLFEATGEEVVCIGAQGEPVTLVPGRLNMLYCSFNAPESRVYTVAVTFPSAVSSWIEGTPGWTGTVAPADTLPKKVLRLRIPKDANEQNIIIRVDISKGGVPISSQDLDFSVKKMTGLSSAIC